MFEHKGCNVVNITGKVTLYPGVETSCISMILLVSKISTEAFTFHRIHSETKIHENIKLHLLLCILKVS